jgi:hypothetical protein
MQIRSVLLKQALLDLAILGRQVLDLHEFRVLVGQ